MSAADPAADILFRGPPTDRTIAAATQGFDCLCVTVLASGTDAALWEWRQDARAELFDGRRLRRGHPDINTGRYRLWIYSEAQRAALPNVIVNTSPREAVERAIAAARKHDVSLQLLCTRWVDKATRRVVGVGDDVEREAKLAAGMDETWPVLYVASHGATWPPVRRRRRKTR